MYRNIKREVRGRDGGEIGQQGEVSRSGWSQSFCSISLLFFFVLVLNKTRKLIRKCGMCSFFFFVDCLELTYK